MSATRLVCPETVRWVKDADRILVVDESRNRLHVLQGAPAAVWGWLTLAYPHRKLVRLLAELLLLSPVEAEEQLSTYLQNWQTAGLLAADDDSRDG